MSEAPEMMPPHDAAAYIGLAVATLAKARCLGGPCPIPFYRLGRKIMYRRADLDEWLSSHRATSTSDADARLPKRLTEAA